MYEKQPQEHILAATALVVALQRRMTVRAVQPTVVGKLKRDVQL